MVATANTQPTALSSSSGLDCRITAGDLKRAIGTLARVGDKRSTMPMLANVLIRVTETGVMLAATDLNVSATFTGPALTGVSRGGVCVNAKSLSDIAKSLSGTDVALTQTGMTGLKVSDGQSDIALIGMHERDFPKVPDASDPALVYHATDAAAFADMLERVAFSICKDETRFHLNGIRVESTGTTVRMVTTDGHRLTRHDAPLKSAPTNGVILPQKAATEIARLLKSEKGAACSIAYKGHMMFVRIGGWTMTAKLIDAQFPPYEQVIPKDHSKLATIERKPFIAALKRAQQLALKTRGVRLDFARGKITLTTEHPDQGTASESLKAESQWLDMGGSGRFGVNANYLLDVLGEIGDAHVTLAFGDELDPVLVRGTDDAVSYSVQESRFLGVVMPMRI